MPAPLPLCRPKKTQVNKQTPNKRGGGVPLELALGHQRRECECECECECVSSAALWESGSQG